MLGRLGFLPRKTALPVRLLHLLRDIVLRLDRPFCPFGKCAAVVLGGQQQLP